MEARPARLRLPASGFARALMAICIGFAAHAALAHLFLSATVAGDLPPLDQGPRTAVSFTVGITAVSQLVTALLLHWRAGPGRHLIRWIPRVGRFLPPLAAPGIVVLSYDPALLDGVGRLTALGHGAPVIAATWASGLMVALLQERVLHALAIRRRIRTAQPLLDSYEPPALADTFGHVLSGCCFATSLLAAAFMLNHLGTAPGEIDSLRTGASTAGLLICIGLSGLAGSSIGRSTGRDVSSIARRLDAIGYNRRQRMDQPVVVTSLDEVGTLFHGLEALRRRLAREVGVYEGALDRTRETEAQKAEFLAAVSHELRTPLNSICGFAQLLLDGVPSPLTKPQQEDVQLVLAGGRQLLSLINDILDISMIESGELSLSFDHEDLGTLIDEVVSIHSSLVRDKNVILRIKTPPDLPQIVCDRRRISQVLTNLLSNAIKFTEEGHIEIRTQYSTEDRRLRIAVEDTGEGIEEDRLGDVFQEYEQVGSLKLRAAGTGLGLAIARTIAEHHGGSLTVASEHGRGSIFALELPFEPPGRPESIDMTAEAARKSLHKPTLPQLAIRRMAR